jgi:hypothetical protein
MPTLNTKALKADWERILQSHRPIRLQGQNEAEVGKLLRKIKRTK